MLDKTDKKILQLLQQNARITNAELAERVNLSPTPCLRRVKRLEELNVIQGYSAIIDKAGLGLQISAFVSIQLDRNSLKNAKDFELAIRSLDQVLDCYVLAGGHDYLLHVVAADLSQYERFIKEKLAGIKQIAKIDTTIVLNQVKNSGLPIV